MHVRGTDHGFARDRKTPSRKNRGCPVLSLWSAPNAFAISEAVNPGENVACPLLTAQTDPLVLS